MELHLGSGRVRAVVQASEPPQQEGQQRQQQPRQQQEQQQQQQQRGLEQPTDRGRAACGDAGSSDRGLTQQQQQQQQDGQQRLPRATVPPSQPGTRYGCERLAVPAPDGALVPLTLLTPHSRGPPGPLLLHAYGAYGEVQDLSYDPTTTVLLDRG
jgi:hypothetical protein